MPTGCFSKDQVYLDGIVRILRHRQTIDFPLLTSLGKVSGHGLQGPSQLFSSLQCSLRLQGARRFLGREGGGRAQVK